MGEKHSHTEEEQRLKLYENVVLKRMFGRKRDDLAGDWRKLQNEFNDCTPHHTLLM